MSKYLNIVGSSEKLRVNNIFCVGKNYLEHIKEFGNDIVPENPVIFFKPNTAILGNNTVINIPELNGKKISEEVHYETEMIVAIGQDCYRVTENEADEYILGYGIGLDLTLRDIQTKAKKTGLPWGTSKGFYNSAPISDIVLRKNVYSPLNLDIKLQINNTIKQISNTKLMIINIYKLIAYISTIFGLYKGDLIFTGTPEGVGKLNKGDKILATLSNIVELNVRYNG